MGAFAHVVGFNKENDSILHFHPLGAEPSKDSDRGGPHLKFHILASKPGPVRFWAQVEVADKQHYVPFTTTVSVANCSRDAAGDLFDGSKMQSSEKHPLERKDSSLFA